MEPTHWEEKRALIRHYNGLASGYDSLYRDEQYLKIEAALEAISFADSDSVLDVGCGTGFLFDHIKNTVKLLVGLDISSGLLRIAAERSKSLHRRSSIHLIRADADHMPFSKEIFGKVLAVTLLQNSPDPIATLGEMTRVARSDATIAVTSLKKSFPEEELRSILSKAGLDVSILESVKQAQDIVAICHKVHNTKNKKRT